ncbi:MAG: hypothetical protein K9L82_06775 [Chromatiaceae bacterium]|nr:hypothetical protein [Chromatiaceae bacterium]MCF7993551.1 hypothetical protein [Chromatiaceae bacterium]MCF8014465.1 hypothetical protein [Chromatiaceae bacterium]
MNKLLAHPWRMLAQLEAAESAYLNPLSDGQGLANRSRQSLMTGSH